MPSITAAMLIQGYTISRPGNYRLEGSAAVVGRRGLVISASDVSVDLQGYSMEGSSITNAVIELEGQQANITVCDGAVRGGLQGLFIGFNCRNVSFQNLYVANFRFAGLVMKPSRDIAVTSCTFGRAHSAPTGSLFGIVALPKGGFSSANKIMQGAPVRSDLVNGGEGLVFSRVTVSDICPLLATGCPHQAPPFITDVGGFRINTSSDSDSRPCRVLNLTHDLGQRFRLLGSIPRPDPKAPEAKTITSAGAHAVALFNWLRVQGVPHELSILRPSSIPGCRGWGTSSALLEMQSQRAAPQHAAEELAQVPLGVVYVRMRQDATPPGAYVPGAMGSFVALSC